MVASRARLMISSTISRSMASDKESEAEKEAESDVIVLCGSCTCRLNIASNDAAVEVEREVEVYWSRLLRVHRDCKDVAADCQQTRRASVACGSRGNPGRRLITTDIHGCTGSPPPTSRQTHSTSPRHSQQPVARPRGSCQHDRRQFLRSLVNMEGCAVPPWKS